MPQRSNRERKKIGALQRAFDILNLFDAQTKELGNTDIARAVQLHPSTVAGLIHTLEVNGYLAQNPATRKYRLGLKLVERAAVALNHLDLREIAQPYLRALRDECNESVNLAIQDGAEVVYIEQLFGSHALGIRSEIGKRAALHSTALGKAILAWRAPKPTQEFLKTYKLTAITPKTITRRDQFLRELTRTRAHGFALDDEENEIGGRCIAAPIFDARGAPIAAVSIAVPIQRFPDKVVPRLGARVRKVAHAISQQLGYAPKSF
ncbi:MAG: IclR family transcriptional regulator [Chloroflexi bacterium]|nr:IclR family transcriptional regulator [Chloroflexota bacterium]